MGRPKSVLATKTIASDYVGTKDAAAILGVSVSSVQKLVNAGKLEAWRTDGGHRRISIRSLQQVAKESAPPKAAEVAAPATVRSGNQPMFILVVEDNPVMSKALGKQLERYGNAVRAGFTNDAAEALLRVAEEKPDLVLTDLAMQPFDGFHLIRVLRSSPRYRNVSIVVLSGLSDEEIAAKGGVPPGTTVYRKPISYERLGGFLDALIQARGASIPHVLNA